MFQPWLLWAITAFLAYGAWAVLSKVVGDSIAPAQAQALSTLGMLPMIAALPFLKGPRDPGNRRRGILIALIGGTVSCLGNIPFFGALSEANAAAVVPITALYPLVTVVLAVAIIRERLGIIQAAGIPLSLAAIYMLNLSETAGFFSPLLLLALVPVLLWGVAGFLQKLSTRYVSGNTSATWFLAAFVPAGAAILLWQAPPEGLSWRIWLLEFALGFTLAFGNYAVIIAYARSGKASIITPLVGLYPLVVIPFAIWMFDERIGWREGLGVALALVSILALSYEPVQKNFAPIPLESPTP